MHITLKDAIDRYGPIESGKWADEGKWCVLVPVPSAISATWICSLTGLPTKHIYCNKDMAEALKDALNLVIQRGLISELKTFDGCFMIRDVRGEAGSPSTHSYACAIDINAATNKLGEVGDMSNDLTQCFRDAGFSAGKYFSRLDPMHFSFAWE